MWIDIPIVISFDRTNGQAGKITTILNNNMERVGLLTPDRDLAFAADEVVDSIFDFYFLS